MPTPAQASSDFLKIASEFQLGELPTESRHPKTKNLSRLSRTNLEGAIRLLQDVEIDALNSAFASTLSEVRELTSAIRKTWDGGGKVFLCGCGATGRLSVSLEALWRKDCAEKSVTARANDVVSFIAGGDYALVRSIENFEDHPDYGARQLRDLSFSKKDLLIAITEGGETPFVIGAAQEASTIATSPTWFLFCNPKEALEKVARSREVFQNTKIRSVSFSTGPMALTGSTRLQASTVLMAAVGSALAAARDQVDPVNEIKSFREALKRNDFSVLAPLISREAEAYLKGMHCLHSAQEHAVTVLTDTTERSPTFSVTPFENELHRDDCPAWTYLVVPQATNAKEAWEMVLMRPPRALTWSSVAGKYDETAALGFDFSSMGHARRNQTSSPRLVYSVESRAGELRLSIGGRSASLPAGPTRLIEHLILKCALNMSSTLVMGRLGRFESNLMLYVKASNNKLIDRSIRFISLLLADRGLHFDYDVICGALFETRPRLGTEESIVLKTLERLAITKGQTA